MPHLDVRVMLVVRNGLLLTVSPLKDHPHAVFIQLPLLDIARDVHRIRAEHVDNVDRCVVTAEIHQRNVEIDPELRLRVGVKHHARLDGRGHERVDLHEEERDHEHAEARARARASHDEPGERSSSRARRTMHKSTWSHRSWWLLSGRSGFSDRNRPERERGRKPTQCARDTQSRVDARAATEARRPRAMFDRPDGMLHGYSSWLIRVRATRIAREWSAWSPRGFGSRGPAPKYAGSFLAASQGSLRRLAPASPLGRSEGTL